MHDFSSHKSKQSLNLLKAYRTEVSVIPGGLLDLDIGINNIIKKHLKKEYIRMEAESTKKLGINEMR